MFQHARMKNLVLIEGKVKAKDSAQLVYKIYRVDEIIKHIIKKVCINYKNIALHAKTNKIHKMSEMHN